MTLEESAKLLAMIKLAYPNSYKGIDNETTIATVNMWHRTFKATPYRIIEIALDHFVKGSKFPPTIADIIEELRNMYYEATQNVLTTIDGKEREINLYIRSQTEQYTDRNDKIIQRGSIGNLLKGESQPLIGG